MKKPANNTGKNTNTDHKGLPVKIEITKLAINADIKLNTISHSYHTPKIYQLNQIML